MINEPFGWSWIFAGMVTGLVLGLRFHDPDWLGGYGAWPRRLVRLGHVAFFGLGLLNVQFAHTPLHLGPALVAGASWLWVAGGVLMPICCLTAAARPTWPPALLFTPPVTCLLLACGITVAGVVR